MCTHWAVIIKACPRFWTAVRASYTPRQLATYLARSRDAPLHLSTTSSKNIETFLHFTRSHIHRWRSAQIVVKSGYQLGALDAAAPILRNLSIERASSSRATIHAENPFVGCTPQLRILNLTDITIDWDSVLFQGLRGLKIELTGLGEESRPSMAQIATVLTSCPTLKHLALKFGRERTPEASPKPESKVRLPIINLPHLEHMLLNLDGALCYNMLSRLSAPDCRLVHIDSAPRGFLPIGSIFDVASKLARESDALQINIGHGGLQLASPSSNVRICLAGVGRDADTACELLMEVVKRWDVQEEFKTPLTLALGPDVNKRNHIFSYLSSPYLSDGHLEPRWPLPGLHTLMLEMEHEYTFPISSLARLAQARHGGPLGSHVVLTRGAGGAPIRAPPKIRFLCRGHGWSFEDVTSLVQAELQAMNSSA